mgnify:CR=1 FL=1
MVSIARFDRLTAQFPSCFHGFHCSTICVSPSAPWHSEHAIFLSTTCLLWSPVAGGVPSDPYLMTGFERKTLHLANEDGRANEFDVEVDFLGHGRFKRYATIPVPANGYVAHAFPEGFGAHWVRVTAHRDGRASAYFHYC